MLLRYFRIGYINLLFPFSIGVTLLAIILIIKFKQLHQTSFYLALQIIILELVFTIISLPFTTIVASVGHWTLGLPFCNVTGALFLFFFQFRQYLMLVFVCDRFCTVFMPFRYPKSRNKVIWTLYTATLVINVLAVVIPIALDCFSLDRNAWLCVSLVTPECQSRALCQAYGTISFVTSQITGSFVPMVMYIALFIKSKRIRSQILPSGTQQDVEQRKRDRRVNLTFSPYFSHSSEQISPFCLGIF